MFCRGAELRKDPIEHFPGVPALEERALKVEFFDDTTGAPDIKLCAVSLGCEAYVRWLVLQIFADVSHRRWLPQGGKAQGKVEASDFEYP